MTAACGIDCGVCEFKPQCGGCGPGTHPGAQARLDEIKRIIGFICPVLKCAMTKRVDYCLRCESFPCEIHYKYNYPYSDFMLDAIKSMKQMRNDFGGEEFKKEQRRIALKYQKPG